MAGLPATPPSDAGFEVVRKGYEQEQVDAHLRRLDAEVSILVADRDAALAQAVQLARELDESRLRAEKLRAQVRTLASPQQSAKGTSERIRSMLRLAEDEVADMLANAESEAGRRTEEANAYADTLREQARTDTEKTHQELDREREAFALERDTAQERLAAERTATEADLAARTEAADDARARAWAESEEQRKVEEEDFAIAMAQRRAESSALLTAERDATHRDCEELRRSAAAQAREEIAGAEARVRELVADAERRINEIVSARSKIAEQLGRTATMLEDTLGSLALSPEQLLAPIRSAAVPSGGAAAAPQSGHEPTPQDDLADYDAPSNGTPAEPAAAPVPSPRRRQRRRTAGASPR